MCFVERRIYKLSLYETSGKQVLPVQFCANLIFAVCFIQGRHHCMKNCIFIMLLLRKLLKRIGLIREV